MQEINKRVVLDVDRCIGCRSCSSACFYGHHGMPNVNYTEFSEGTMPMICRQCPEAACVDTCPSGSLERSEEGAVVRSLMMCWGCHSCAFACPFGVLSEDLTRRQVAKCDLDVDRTSQGKLPRCVATCPAGALQFVEVDDVEKDHLLLISGRTLGRSPYKRR